MTNHITSNGGEETLDINPSNSIWYIDAIISSLTGLMLGLAISLMMSIALYMKLPYAEQIEREGLDLGISLSVFWNTLLSNKGRPDKTHAISILDLDEAACEALISSKIPCQFERIGQPTALLKILKAVSRSKAKIIVADVYLPDEEEAKVQGSQAEYILKLLEQTGPPVIAAIPHYFGTGDLIRIDWSKSICGKPRCGRLYYSVGAVWSKYDSVDNLTRYYPLKITVSEIESLNTNTEPGIKNEREIGTIPLLVADAVKELRPNSFLNSKFNSSSEDKVNNDLKSSQLSDESRYHLIAYTIPAKNEEKLPDHQIKRQFFDNFSYRYLSEYTKLDKNLSHFPDYENQIVIIGSSSPIANDWHNTPLGTMSGAEIIANSIRSIELNRLNTIKVNRWIIKISSVLITSAVMFLVWFIIKYLENKRSNRVFFDKYTFLILITITFGVVISLALEIILMISNNFIYTRQVDVLIPVIGVFFECFYNFLNHLLSLISIFLKSIKELTTKIFFLNNKQEQQQEKEKDYE